MIAVVKTVIQPLRHLPAQRGFARAHQSDEDEFAVKVFHHNSLMFDTPPFGATGFGLVGLRRNFIRNRQGGGTFGKITRPSRTFLILRTNKRNQGGFLFQAVF
ncbi:hypothetical protein F7O43_11660 [Neisseria meningitidis]|nr:hypothetical protein [Neisseria meningitidis]MBG8582537.1 hypothetical protein [Neisseria meningitidis]MBG8593257.1 hypothetical protein [Neisseria meningitidis]MBG8599338.1 hypothetical protein [Neisseria meningitidis]MBG8602719.1 hypothetical protein [Neisseria meningitidis]